MSSLSRRALRGSSSMLTLGRPMQVRLNTTAIPPAAPTESPSGPSSKGKKGLSPVPLHSPAPIFPTPANPFEPAPSKAASAYSDSTKSLVKNVAKLMGYNSRASTAIRETGRMVKSAVDAVQRDQEFWYQECRLPETYQTFFQLHLLYILMLLPRLRALPASEAPLPHSIPEPESTSPPTGTSVPGSSSAPLLSKPHWEAYPAELLNHFFEMAEAQMRIVLGKGEKERIVAKYMAEFAEQWKGAGVGLDYVVGLSSSESEADRAQADQELASWLWRNLFQGRGLVANALESGERGWKDAEMAEQLEKVVLYVRKEMRRLDDLEDADVLGGNIGSWSRPE